MIFNFKRLGRLTAEIDIRERIDYADYISFNRYVETYGCPVDIYPVDVYYY